MESLATEQFELFDDLSVEPPPNVAELEPQHLVDAARYRVIRKGLGLSTGELAALLGTCQRTIQHRETGFPELRSEHWLALDSISQGIQRRRLEKIFQAERGHVLAFDKGNLQSPLS